MHRSILLSASAAAALAVSPVHAQTAAAPADAGVRDYLCTFAGKCDGAAAATDEAPVMAAPATKGFRLATAPMQQAQGATTAAPATKGFRLVGPGAQAPSTSAPSTKGFRLVTPAKAPAPARAAAPRRVASAARAAPVAAAATGTRADLMLAFQYNSDQMTPAAETKARTFARALMMPELSGKRFLIEGHTDARGDRAFNIDLSRRRAQSVADFLVAQGVDAARVEVKGVGPDEPLPGLSRNAEANRRVEAVLLG